jgi:hypothetical protein
MSDYDNLKQRVDEIETSIKTAKIWLKVLGSIAAFLGLSAIASSPFVYKIYNEYQMINHHAEEIENKFQAHEAALKKLDDWKLPSPPDHLKTPPVPPHTLPDPNADLKSLSSQIHEFNFRQGTTYDSDVLTLRNFAIKYFDYIAHNPNADPNGKVLGEIKDAVDPAVNRALIRGEFNGKTEKDKTWLGTTAPNDFKYFLGRFQGDRPAMLSDPRYMSCYQELIPFWYNSLTTGPVPESQTCSDISVNPYKY